MSFQVTDHFVKQFSDNIVMKAQQRGSRVRDTVTIKDDVTGKEFFQDQIGATAAQKKTNRHGDTPLISTPHSRRKGIMFDYEWADLIDKLDKVKMLNDPTSEYVINAAWAMGRAMDDEVITAINGTSYSGEEGSTSVTLPAAQQVAVAASGLTLAKLLSTKEILDGADVAEAEDDMRTILVSAKQVTNLLNTTEIKSAEYNTVKALAEGQIDTFMGFKFVRTERLNTDGSGDRLCLAYTKSGVCLGISMDVVTDIGVRRDKSLSTQVYHCMSIGATRLEEEKVVEIACSES